MKLFQSDNQTINYPVLNKVEVNNDSLTKAIRSNYSHLEINKPIYKIGETNNNFILGDYFIKTISHNRNKKHIENLPRIVDYLRKSNIPTVSYIKNNRNQYISNFIDNNNEQHNCLFLQEKLEGSYFNGSKKHLSESLDLLINLEKTNIKIKDRETYGSKFINWNPLLILIEVEDKINRINTKSEFDLASKILISKSKSLLAEYDSQLKILQGSISTLHHNDLHPLNLLFHKYEILALIDLESFINIPFNLSSSFALFKLGRKSISTKQLSLIQFKKECIEKGFDLNNILPFLQLELIRRGILVMDLHYLKENKIWDNDLYKHNNGLEESRLMLCQQI
jgi:thiamine kinase-like enzyme